MLLSHKVARWRLPSRQLRTDWMALLMALRNTCALTPGVGTAAAGGTIGSLCFFVLFSLPATFSFSLFFADDKGRAWFAPATFCSQNPSMPFLASSARGK